MRSLASGEMCDQMLPDMLSFLSMSARWKGGVPHRRM